MEQLENPTQSAIELMRNKQIAERIDKNRTIDPDLSYMNISADLEIGYPNYDDLSKIKTIWDYCKSIDPSDPKFALYSIIKKLDRTVQTETKLSQVLHYINMERLGNKYSKMARIATESLKK